MAVDVYQMVSDRLIAELESGIIPWSRPWTGCREGAFSGATGRPYSILNQMILGKPGAWVTWNEIQKRGGRVRKGERSSYVVFWKSVKVSETDPVTGETSEKLVPMLRYYLVFHVSQCDGLKLDELPPAGEIEESPTALQVIGDYLAAQPGLRLEKDSPSNKAYYSPAADEIVVPCIRQFSEQGEYYSTVFHEMTHSTGHKSRLDRLSSTAHFGDESYSKEELVAEIGAATLWNLTGTESGKSFRNSAAYLQGWLRALRNDKKLIVQASGAAAKAVDFILGRPAPEYT